jgi:hypothetical protein
MKNIYQWNPLKGLVSLVVPLGLLLPAFVTHSSTDELAETHSSIATFEGYRNQTNQAFQSGEILTYRVHYGLVNAAVITMAVKSDSETFDRPSELVGRKAFHIMAEGNTIKAFDWAFKVRDRYDSWVDEESLCPLKYTKQVQENKYKDHDLVYFRHPSGKLNARKGALDMKPFTQDIISALYYARTIDFASANVGDSFPLSVYLDYEIYNLDFKYMGIETIKSDLGKIKCYKIRPRLVVDRVFNTEEDMTIWVSADKNKIPVRVQTNIKVGSLKVDITSFEGLKNPFSSLQKK